MTTTESSPSVVQGEARMLIDGKLVESSSGRQCGPEGFEQYLQTKTVALAVGPA